VPGMSCLSRISSLLAAILLCACGGGGGGGAPAAQQQSSNLPTNGSFVSTAGLSPSAALGQLIFADPALSGNQTSCISCHDADFALSLPAQSAVALGGLQKNMPGFRNPPQITYAIYLPPFSLNGAAQGPGQPAVAAGIPVGGMFFDGRLDTLTQQAGKPFFSPFEMADPDAATLAKQLATRPYAQKFTALFGANIFNN